MARNISMEAPEQKITKAEQEVAREKRNYDSATSELKKLLDKSNAVRSQELMKTVAESPLTYGEILNLIRTAGTFSTEES